jgi:hypothetical protein
MQFLGNLIEILVPVILLTAIFIKVFMILWRKEEKKGEKWIEKQIELYRSRETQKIVMYSIPYLSLAIFGMLAILVVENFIYSASLARQFFDQTSQNYIIYDAQSNVIIKKIWYHDWLVNKFERENRKRYLIAVKVLESHGDFFIAKLQLSNTDSETLKKAATHWKDERNDYRRYYTPDTDLSNAIFVCVNSLTKTSFRVEENHYVAIRELSVTDMNERCPLAPKFGYKWVSLEVKLL